MKIFLFLLISAKLSVAQVVPLEPERQREAFNESERFFGPPIFLYDFFCFRSGSDYSYSRIDLHIGFCNDILQFVKESNDRFHAQYELMITVFDKKGNHMSGKTIAENILVQNFAETNRRDITQKIYYTFELIPDDYKVVIELTDQDTRKTLRREEILTVRGFQADRVRMSDIIFTDSMPSVGAEHVLESIRPNLNRIFKDAASSFRACVEVYPVSLNDSLRVRCMIYDIHDKLITEQRDVFIPQQKTYFHIINLQDLIVDANKYRIKITAEQNNSQDEITDNFSTSWKFFNVSMNPNQRGIEPLREYISSGDWELLQAASDAPKERWLKDYWQQRDPNPDTEKNELMEEFYRRVDFINYHFSINDLNKNAWETDRGRIYLKYGPPSNVDRYTNELNIPPYEIWYYASVNRRFIFEDRAGNGDYLLVKIE